MEEEEQFTIEVNSESDIQNNIKTNIDKNNKNLKNANYPRQNNKNKKIILGKLYKLNKIFNFR